MNMNQSLTISDTLIGSLCREIEYIRQRYKNVNCSLINCNNNILRNRLKKEIIDLKERRTELIEISNCFKNSCKGNLSTLFLYELCTRPLEIYI